MFSVGFQPMASLHGSSAFLFERDTNIKIIATGFGDDDDRIVFLPSFAWPQKDSMDSSSAAHSITLDPTDSLSFALALGSSPQAALVISNPSSVENVAFKVKTTRPMRYLVRPNQGVIGPNSSATVLVILQQKDCDELLRLDASERQLSNDKFLVQSVGVDAEFCDLLTKKSAKEVMDDLTTLWANAEKKTISNKKLRCRFIEGSSADVSTPSQLTSALLETPPEATPKSLSTQQSVYASTAEDSIRQEMMAEMAVLRKKYDEVVHHVASSYSLTDPTSLACRLYRAIDGPARYPHGRPRQIAPAKPETHDRAAAIEAADLGHVDLAPAKARRQRRRRHDGRWQRIADPRSDGRGTHQGITTTLHPRRLTQDCLAASHIIPRSHLCDPLFSHRSLLRLAARVT